MRKIIIPHIYTAYFDESTSFAYRLNLIHFISSAFRLNLIFNTSPSFPLAFWMILVDITSLAVQIYFIHRPPFSFWLRVVRHVSYAFKFKIHMPSPFWLILFLISSFVLQLSLNEIISPSYHSLILLSGSFFHWIWVYTNVYL